MSPVWFLVLRRPRQIRRNLLALHAAGRIAGVPTLFQVFQGVLYMVHRIVFRPSTIGIQADATVRDTRRARWLAWRAIRLPVVVWARVINPLDLTGLGSTPGFLRRHVIGTYHPRENAIYDLAILSVEPGALEGLRADVVAVLDGSHPRAALYRDLVVYEGYHERLLGVVDRALTGDFRLTVAGSPDSDASLAGYVAWLLERPATPRAWLRGDVTATAPSP